MKTETPHINTGKKRPFLMLAGLILVLSFAVAAGWSKSKNYEIRKITVIGIGVTTEEMVLNSASIAVGTHPDSVNFDAAIKRIEKLPYVKYAVVGVEPSGDVHIVVEERKPIAFLMSGKTRSYIDEDGVFLGTHAGISRDVPLLYGFSAGAPGAQLKSDAFKQVASLLAIARTNEFAWMSISEMAFTDEQGVVALSRENGIKLIFGESPFEEKIENWVLFNKEIIRTKGAAAFRQIDLRFKDQVITREI